MAQEGWVPMGRVLDILSSARDAEMERIEQVWVRVLVDPQAERSLVLAVKDALLPVQSGASLSIDLLREGAVPTPEPMWDLAVIVAGGSDALVRAAAESLALRGVPVVVLAESVLDAPEPRLQGHAAQLVSVVASSSTKTLTRDFAKWVVSASEKGTAVAANFPFCRKARVDALVRTYAAKNAAASAMSSSSDGDSATMTSNQAKLFMDVAATYGRAPTLGRAAQLAGVMWINYGSRSLTQAALGVVPGSGWAVKAGMGYLGTVAMARGVAAFFEHVDGRRFEMPTVAGVTDDVRSYVRDKTASFVKRHRSDEDAEAPIVLSRVWGGAS